MQRGGGSGKGSNFERDVCRQLSLWITHGKKADCLWRSSMSGGRATVARKRGELVRQAGDITAVAPEGHVLTDNWYIECKAWSDLQLNKFILLGKGDLAKIWEDTIKQADIYNRKPLLIVKPNYFPTIVLAYPDDLCRYAFQGHAHSDDFLCVGDTYEIWLLEHLVKVKFRGQK